MRRNNLKNFIYNGGKTSTSQALMYQHMSNHYRKILNAKKAVDSSAPRYFKPRRTSTSSPSPARSISPCKKILSRNTSPVLTERSVSTNSYGGSCWEAESYISKKSHRSRYQESKRGRSPTNAANVDMELLDRIVFDTKHGPAAYFEVSWESNRIEKNVKDFKNLYDDKKSRPTVNPVSINTNSKRKSINKSRVCPQKRMFFPKEKIPPDIMDRHSEFFASFSSEFYPRILKSDAPSKLRDLRVYHPPRRKADVPKNSWMENEDSSRTPIDCNIKTSQCKCSETCSCERNENLECKCSKANKEQSQTSSRDSAYNGGVSSLPESRSPTPDQKKTEKCRCQTKNSRELADESTEESEAINPMNSEYDVTDENTDKERKSKAKEKINGHRSISPKYLKSLKKKSDEESRKKMKEDALYTKLIEDITSEVLQKGLFTNKALKKVMKRHLTANLGILDKDRMLREVDNLRIQLGIPEDDSLLNLRPDSVESATDVRECCPIVSDTAFTTSDEPTKTDELKYLSYSWTSHHYLKKKPPPEEKKIPDKKSIRRSFSEVVENSSRKKDEGKGHRRALIDEDESVSVLQLKKFLDQTKTETPSYSASYPNDSANSCSDEDEDSEKVAKRKKSRGKPSPVRRKSNGAAGKAEKMSDSSESEEEKTVKEILPKPEEVKVVTESPKKKNVNFISEEKDDRKKKESVSGLENENQKSNKVVNALFLKTAKKGSFDPSPLFEESQFVVNVDDSADTIVSSEGSKLTTNSGEN